MHSLPGNCYGLGSPLDLRQGVRPKTCTAIEKLAKKFFQASDFLFLGRGINYPVALEGALKLKEISYIHAEGYPAGEMKHGPIALIDDDLPVVALAPDHAVYDKMLANIEEVKARDKTQSCMWSIAALAAEAALDAPRASMIAAPLC